MAGTTRVRRDLGGDRRSRRRRIVAVCQSKTVNGLRRNRTQRRLQSRAQPAREYHQDGKCAFTAGGCGSWVGLPTPTGRGGKVAQATSAVREEVKQIVGKAQHRLQER